MLTEKVKYVNYNGEEVEEILYFNLSKRELLDWNYSSDEDLHDRLKRISEEKNPRDLYFAFTEIIDRTYGVKSPDGRQFIKTPEELQKFKQSRAYDAFIFSIMEDEKKAANFVAKVLPEDLSAAVAEGA